MADGLIVRDGGRTLIAEVKAKGYFILDDRWYENTFTRNMGFMVDGLLRRANVTVYTETGSTVTAVTGSGGLLRSNTSDYNMGCVLYLHWGTGTRATLVTDNDLVAPDGAGRAPVNYWTTVEEDTRTLLLLASRWTPDGNKLYNEVGVKWVTHTSAYTTLLARSALPSSESRTAYNEYFDGYALSFPASFTRWFVKALWAASTGNYSYLSRGCVITATDGSIAVVQTGDTFAGNPDVMIGTDNSAPSPTHYNLLSPIASLGSQSQTVEVDTSLNQVRVVRTGSYTPSTDTVLGELGLFCNVNAYVGGSLVTRRIMVCRAVVTPPVTLKAGTTYTLGIALVFP